MREIATSRFLDEMARSSAQRVASAARLEPIGALERRARAHAPAPRLRLSAQGFDVIAEIKLRSPAAGVLGSASDDWLSRAADYARAGAAAVSVLTEPSRFDGSLEHLGLAAAKLAPLGVPVMRKDFLVDPYQILEARAEGAGGVLVILRMLPRSQIVALLDVAAEHQLFVLLEAFDGADLALAGELSSEREGRADVILIGVNSRDLQTLEVVPERFAALAPQLPRAWPAVAESGVSGAEQAAAMRALGYRLALIGTALMVHDDPAALLAHIFAVTRTVSS
ncbi:MAG: indole-3-glycerol phosphate synthase TrpC [Steroidobacteraceae bacterium]|jgi:indole-3-glycerol phosphate synthase